ncbi:hypothetical protein [Siphonobacter sp. SORGH_AS_1065]|uniref:hypothetical protein n=1 Tax=Siphonobacter sp. SORGH_AS_1065 TaxID=3041795 RepID=UPI0027885FB2|nr:hypothetical protein [Siphonobacter sp. SORGH_AS_1065]MDQ1087565.1 hypothetical protein [Siphonobacter sp. SORGH_AS_1065]
MNRKILVAFGLQLLCIGRIWAQTQTIMPPLPTTSSLVNYIDKPVSTYTGIPQINIPLWNIKLKNIELPITLTYDAGGVKVEQEASNVGLSWSLVVGGVITRSVRDIPDDYNRYENIPRIEDRPFDSSPSGEHPRIGRFWSGKYEVLKNFDFNNTDWTYVSKSIADMKSKYKGLMLDGMNDLEPDIFYFSFGDKYGKFVFDVNGTNQSIIMLPYQELSISHTIDTKGEIATFTVIDSDGTQYLFDKVERLERINASITYPTPLAAVLDPDLQTTESTVITKFNSSWFLSKITTINQETVIYSYTDESSDQYDRPSSTGKIGKYNTVNIEYNFLLSNNSSRTKSTTQKRISKIETDSEIVEFIANHQRQDKTLPSYAITNIQIKNKITGEFLRIFDLNYSYFQSPTSEAFNGMSNVFVALVGSENPSYYKRLKLNSITEKAGDGSLLPPYVFSYHESVALPHRFTYQQDIWGYFNGQSSNKNLFPTTYIYSDLQGSDRYRVYPRCNATLPTGSSVVQGGNRLPNSEFMKMGSLYKIVYPTGGYTEFEYEVNRFLYDNCEYEGGGIRIKNIKNYIASSQLATRKSYNYLDYQGKSSGRIISMPTFVMRTLVQLFYYSSSQNALGTTNGSYVGYEMVKETSESQSNGSIIYEYSVPATYNQPSDTVYGLYEVSKVKWLDQLAYTNDPKYIALKNEFNLQPNMQPYPPNPDYDWNRGKLIKQTFFNSSGSKVKEIIRSYKIYDASLTKGVKEIYGFSIYSFMGCLDSGCSATIYSKYKLLTNRANVLKSVQEINY